MAVLSFVVLYVFDIIHVGNVTAQIEGNTAILTLTMRAKVANFITCPHHVILRQRMVGV